MGVEFLKHLNDMLRGNFRTADRIVPALTPITVLSSPVTSMTALLICSV